MPNKYDPLHIIKCGTNNEGDTRNAYMMKLQKWCAEAMQHNMQMLALYQSYSIQLQQSPHTPRRRNHNQTNNTPIDLSNTSRTGYYIYTIPPIWKRFAAELIDFILLFTLKMVFTIIIIDHFNLLDFEHYTLSEFEERLQNPKLAGKLTLELFSLEIFHRVIVCFYEAYWIAVDSATPGKKILGLSVVHAVILIQPVDDMDRVIAHPCTVLSFKDAVLRSVLKNIFIGLLFPICFVMLFFKYNRTGYDLLTNSLVVESGSNLPLVE